jgi:serine/threonine protein kinase HipA of HipAB toxin-antitoxin module
MIDDERIRDRAAGRDDPEPRAEAVLQDCDDREEYRETAPDLRIEHRSPDAAAD